MLLMTQGCHGPSYNRLTVSPNPFFYVTASISLQGQVLLRDRTSVAEALFTMLFYLFSLLFHLEIIARLEVGRSVASVWRLGQYFTPLLPLDVLPLIHLSTTVSTLGCLGYFVSFLEVLEM